jgi:hypothetical protein
MHSTKVPQAAIERGHETGFISWPNRCSWWRLELGRRVEIHSYTIGRPKQGESSWLFEVRDGDASIDKWDRPDTIGTDKYHSRIKYQFEGESATFRLGSLAFAQHIMNYHFSEKSREWGGEEILHIPHIDFAGRIQGDGTYMSLDRLP